MEQLNFATTLLMIISIRKTIALLAIWKMAMMMASTAATTTELIPKPKTIAMMKVNDCDSENNNRIDGYSGYGNNSGKSDYDNADYSSDDNDDDDGDNYDDVGDEDY